MDQNLQGRFRLLRSGHRNVPATRHRADGSRSTPAGLLFRILFRRYLVMGQPPQLPADYPPRRRMAQHLFFDQRQPYPLYPGGFPKRNLDRRGLRHLPDQRRRKRSVVYQRLPIHPSVGDGRNDLFYLPAIGDRRIRPQPEIVPGIPERGSSGRIHGYGTDRSQCNSALHRPIRCMGF